MVDKHIIRSASPGRAKNGNVRTAVAIKIGRNRQISSNAKCYALVGATIAWPNNKGVIFTFILSRTKQRKVCTAIPSEICRDGKVPVYTKGNLPGGTIPVPNEPCASFWAEHSKVCRPCPFKVCRYRNISRSTPLDHPISNLTPQNKPLTRRRSKNNKIINPVSVKIDCKLVDIFKCCCRNLYGK